MSCSRGNEEIEDCEKCDKKCCFDCGDTCEDCNECFCKDCWDDSLPAIVVEVIDIATRASNIAKIRGA